MSVKRQETEVRREYSLSLSGLDELPEATFCNFVTGTGLPVQPVTGTGGEPPQEHPDTCGFPEAEAADHNHSDARPRFPGDYRGEGCSFDKSGGFYGIRLNSQSFKKKKLHERIYL